MNSPRQLAGGSRSVIAPFPDKPEGMHHETYERLHQECQEAELKQLIGMKAG